MKLSYGFFGLAIFFNALMDGVHFGQGVGFWSITDGIFDAWHLSKICMFGCFALAVLFAKEIKHLEEFIRDLFLYAIINFTIHSLFYHGVFKKVFT